MPIPRILEVEIMDTAEEAQDYNAMDHTVVNRLFAADFLAAYSGPGPVLDVGTGTALIPIEICRQRDDMTLVGVDAAHHMLRLARQNIEAAGFSERIRLEPMNAREMAFADGSFPAVISNSIIHHIPQPRTALREMVRVLMPGGTIFVRDLRRPDSLDELRKLVEMYAGKENAHARQMFADSLHAALTLDEVRALVGELGFTAQSVQQSSDRHWTWLERKPTS